MATPRKRGRPRRPDARRHPVRIRLSQQERERLDIVAKLNGQNLAEFIREAVIEAVADCTDELVLVCDAMNAAARPPISVGP